MAAKKPLKIRLLIGAMVLGAAVALFAAGQHLVRVLTVASGFHAKILCSGVFVGKRSVDEVIDQDVLADLRVGLRHFEATVDREAGLVTSALFGFFERRALYRPGLGCTLVAAAGAEALRAQTQGFTPLEPALSPAEPWPLGERVEESPEPAGVDMPRLRRAVESAFAEPRPDRLRRTRAVVVVHKGRLIAERYAPGIGPETPLIGWSLGKSVANALTGVMVREGTLDVAATGLFPEWRAPGDARGQISLDHLLRMTGGLDFDDPHARMLSDVRRMLFVFGDAAAYARAKELAAPPGRSWVYGSGSTILLSDLLRRSVEGGLPAYFNFPRKALFAPLGMASAVIEPDAAGTFLAPAFVHATARDWARFGLFILDDGIWNGERLLPEGWVRASISPSEVSEGLYGAGFWRRIPPFLRPARIEALTLPDDRFYMLGHDGQMVAVIPSRDLVVVRLGLSRRRGAWDHDAFLAELLAAFPGTRS